MEPGNSMTLFFLISCYEGVQKTGSQLVAQNIPIKPIRHHTVPDPTEAQPQYSLFNWSYVQNVKLGIFYVVVVQWSQRNVQKLW